MSVRRIVPNLPCSSPEQSAQFYSAVVGMEIVMDHGWIMTLAEPTNSPTQLSLMTHDETAPVLPVLSIEVDDVDSSYHAAKAAGAEIVHELTDEAWGVRRFFVRDPDGNVVNILSHK